MTNNQSAFDPVINLEKKWDWGERLLEILGRVVWMLKQEYYNNKEKVSSGKAEVRRIWKFLGYTRLRHIHASSTHTQVQVA